MLLYCPSCWFLGYAGDSQLSGQPSGFIMFINYDPGNLYVYGNRY